MLQRIIFFSILAAFTVGSIISIAEDCADDPVASETTNMVSKALLVGDQVHPAIDLPVVEITADRNAIHLVHAEVLEGEIVPSIQLAEVVVVP